MGAMGAMGARVRHMHTYEQSCIQYVQNMHASSLCVYLDAFLHSKVCICFRREHGAMGAMCAMVGTCVHTSLNAYSV